MFIERGFRNRTRAPEERDIEHLCRSYGAERSDLTGNYKDAAPKRSLKGAH